MQPKVYLSCSPRDPGSLTAMFYVEDGVHVYGWYMTSYGHYLSTAFFMIENFYAERTPALYRSIQDDVYEPWTTDYPPTKNAIRCPIPEPVSHELERIQSQFVQEWLFFENDPGIAAELAVYRSHELPVQAANIKSRKLNRLDKDEQVWAHATPGTDLNVLAFVEKYWHFGEKTPARRHMSMH